MKGFNGKGGKSRYFSASILEGELLLYLKGVLFHKGFTVLLTVRPPRLHQSLITYLNSLHRFFENVI